MFTKFVRIFGAFFYIFFNGFEISMKFCKFFNFFIFSNIICLKVCFILVTAKTILKVVVGVCYMQTTYILQCNVIIKISVFFYPYVINIVNLFPFPLFVEREKKLYKGNCYLVKSKEEFECCHCTDIIFYLRK
jgi:hypothetical protein